MLLGARQTENKNQKKTAPAIDAPWWINPFWYIVFFLLPFFLITVFTVGPYMAELGQKINNINSRAIYLGLLSIFMLAIGSIPFVFSARKNSRVPDLDLASVNRVLTFMGGLSFVCLVIYLAPVLANPTLVMFYLSGGDFQTSAVVRSELGQIPGITSFASAALPFFSLYGIMLFGGNIKHISKLNRYLFYILIVLIAARSILGSERLALLEALICFGLPWVAFSWKRSLFRSFLPFVGVMGVYLLFCVGEYFRSWQFYKMKYESFWEFITVRFLGYFATSVNNGSGIMIYYEPIGVPALTASGIYKLIAVFGLHYSPGTERMKDYLSRYATPEFNLPCGLYAPFIDYGVVLGTVYLLFAGMVLGLLYRSFMRGNSLGLLLYPAWFAALLDIMRGWIWGASRIVPVIIISVIFSFVLTRKKDSTGLLKR